MIYLEWAFLALICGYAIYNIFAKSSSKALSDESAGEAESESKLVYFLLRYFVYLWLGGAALMVVLKLAFFGQ